MMKKINLYTDGACKGNPGAGGWAAILEYEGREKELPMMSKRDFAESVLLELAEMLK